MRFAPHNAHWDEPRGFARLDPHLRRLAGLPLVYRSPYLEELPRTTPGVFSLTGGRQVGKTTFFKQWMAELLHGGVAPRAIAFLTGELIDDHHALVRLVQDLLAEMPASGLRYLILDEVTYIRDWDKGVKYLVDAGLTERVALFVTGSDSVLIQEARQRLPGRRGRAVTVDFHLHPLSFRETLTLKGVGSTTDDDLRRRWDEYLVHGGFLPAINDVARDDQIHPATLATYADWIRGDLLKRGKSEAYLRELLAGLERRLGSQLSWGGLAGDLAIEHHQTVADYVQLLAQMDALFVQHALLEDKLVAAPKKAKKVAFADPFIFHAVRQWLAPVPRPHAETICAAVRDPILSSRLTEAAVAAHYRRWYPTYYLKGDGEVDVAYVRGRRFHPIEVQWTEQIRPSDLRQIRKYPNGLVLGRIPGLRTVHDLPYAFLPRHMADLDPL